MQTDVILWGLGVIGIFGTIALSVNAFFLKGIYEDLNALKVIITETVVNAANREKRLTTTEIEVKELHSKFHDLNTELHQLKSLELFREKEGR